jgi:hypothetical protein
MLEEYNDVAVKKALTRKERKNLRRKKIMNTSEASHTPRNNI